MIYRSIYLLLPLHFISLFALLHSERDASDRMRIHSSCAAPQKSSSTPNGGFIQDAYNPAMNLARKVKDTLISFKNNDNTEHTESKSSVHQTVEKGLKSLFGISSEEPDRFNAGLKLIMGRVHSLLLGALLA